MATSKSSTNKVKSAPKKKAGQKSGTAEFFAHHTPFAAGHAAKPVVISSPSPNFASRQGQMIQKLVLHNTDGPLAPSLARLKDPQQQVSAHYVVDRNGDIYQLVDDSNTAWHSGNKSVNQQSIGIEVVAWNTAKGMAAPQEASLVALSKFILDAYAVSLTNVVPHRSIKATDCPGWVWPTDGDLATWKNARLTS
jgi:N-acetylmuramoyl-L-alanine amidase